MAGLAVPAVLGLAGYGLDGLLKLAWPRVILRSPNAQEAHALSFSTAWILVIPLVLGLRAVFQYARSWMATLDSQSVYESTSQWQTASLEWVSPPYGELFWVEPATSLGIKLTNIVAPWNWENRAFPLPRLEATRGEPPAGGELIATTEGVSTFLHPDQHYAYVDLGDQVVACEATGGGGDLSVRCTTDRPGELTVQENAWTGWRAWQDDQPVELLPGPWLRTEAPAGVHVYRFRYLPWDVPVGLALSLLGVALAVFLWVKARTQRGTQDTAE